MIWVNCCTYLLSEFECRDDEHLGTALAQILLCVCCVV